MRSATALVALALVVCTGCATGVTGTPLTVGGNTAGGNGNPGQCNNAFCP